MEQLEALEAKKRAISEVHNEKRRFLEGLQTNLKDIYSKSLPILALLEAPEMTPPHPHARLLPSPLYNVYHLASCFQRSFGTFV